MKEIDKGVTVEKTVTMGETHYRALIAERDRLREALTKARDAIERADPTVLLDTLWMPMDVSPAETVVDFIDAALKRDTQ